MNAVTFRHAEPSDWPAVAALLTALELPTAGAEAHLANFLLGFQGTDLAGVAGLERYGDSTLLRSVAVARTERGTGLGQELVRHLLDEAYASGVKTVVLLTATADRFFPRFGFKQVSRAEVPAGVLSSVEFQGACPSSSTVMRLDLNRPPLLVRLAAPNDIPAITRIYNQGIEDRSTLETQLRTEEERLAWLNGHKGRYPVTVAVQEGAVRGWASLNPFSSRDAYRFVADLSVYVERVNRATGVGTALMLDLMDRSKVLEFHKLVLTTFPELTGAVRLYERLGFRHVGDYEEQGMLDGVWRSTRVMERIL